MIGGNEQIPGSSQTDLVPLGESPTEIDGGAGILPGAKGDPAPNLPDLNGAAGTYRLREEMLSRVSASIRPAKVRDVLFKEIIVQ